MKTSKITNSKELDIRTKKSATSYRRTILKNLLIICVMISIVLSNQSGMKVVKATATGTSVGVAVDYTQEIATVTAGPGGSTRFYISIDGKKNWEMIDASRMVDLSSILSTKAITIYFKGNKDTNEVPYPLQAEEGKDLTVSYKVTGGAGRIEFKSALNYPVEYKKGVNGAWRTATSPIIYTSIYELKGATFYFRTVATTDRRAGKTISIKVGKKPSAPSAKVDGSKLILTGLKSNETVYRTDTIEWKKFTAAAKENFLDLKSILGVAADGTILGGTIELYNEGSDKKVNSSAKVINVAAQAAAPQTVSVTGTSIKISDTNLKTYYEYTVVRKGSTLDLTKAKWTQMTAKNTVIVKNVSVDDKIYVRLKSTTNSATKQTILASAAREFTVTSITLK
jgi:hypothetical protein